MENLTIGATYTGIGTVGMSKDKEIRGTLLNRRLDGDPILQCVRGRLHTVNPNTLKKVNKRFGSKHQELVRTIEVLKDIKIKWKDNSDKQIYFMLAFLNDSSYDMKDIKEIMTIIHERNFNIK
jgi:hypothetical protein